MEFTIQEKIIGWGIYNKLLAGKNKNPDNWLTKDLSQLFKVLNKEEVKFIRKILSINVRDYGKKGPFFGIQPLPKNLVEIKNQKYRLANKTKIVHLQLVPKNVYAAFQKLNKSMQQEIGCCLNIISGYRSPACQMVVLLFFLYQEKWNLSNTLKKVALPGYSEHGALQRQALDFGSVRGINNLADFYKTKEYKWLKKNAHKYDFYLSFGPKNKKGTIFEPWHWHFGNK